MALSLKFIAFWRGALPTLRKALGLGRGGQRWAVRENHHRQTEFHLRPFVILEVTNEEQGCGLQLRNVGNGTAVEISIRGGKRSVSLPCPPPRAQARRSVCGTVLPQTIGEGPQAPPQTPMSCSPSCCLQETSSYRSSCRPPGRLWKSRFCSGTLKATSIVSSNVSSTGVWRLSTGRGGNECGRNAPHGLHYRARHTLGALVVRAGARVWPQSKGVRVSKTDSPSTRLAVSLATLVFLKYRNKRDTQEEPPVRRKFAFQDIRGPTAQHNPTTG